MQHYVSNESVQFKERMEYYKHRHIQKNKTMSEIIAFLMGHITSLLLPAQKNKTMTEITMFLMGHMLASTRTEKHNND